MKNDFSLSPEQALELFDAFKKNGGLEKLRTALQNPALTPDELRSIAPVPLLVMLSGLQSKSFVEQLRTKGPTSELDKLQPIIYGARALPSMLSHKAVRDFLTELKIESDIQREPPFKGISRTQILPIWLESSEGDFAPYLRLRIWGIDDKQMFDETLDWDDLSFVTLTFAEALRSELKRFDRLRNAINIDVENRDKVLERLRMIAAVASEFSTLADNFEVESKLPSKAAGKTE